MSLGKKDIIKNISSKAHISYVNSSSVLEEFLKFLISNKTDNIKISKFGTFSMHKTPKRIGRNPKTKVETIIESRKKVKFKPSTGVKSILN